MRCDNEMGVSEGGRKREVEGRWEREIKGRGEREVEGRGGSDGI